MSAQSSVLRSVRFDRLANYPDAARLLRSERRFLLFGDALAKALASQDFAFLTDLSEAKTPSLQQPSRPQAQRHPLQGYWQDLNKLRPTLREHEFVFTYAISILRRAISQLLEAQPTRQARAIAQEHLNCYSPLLSQISAWDKPVEDKQAPTQDEQALLARLQQRLQDLTRIQNSLVERNLYSVPKLARKYRHLGVPWEDLIQEANASLLRAVERYDPLQGARFSTYATWWIQQGILKCLSFQSRTVRLPVYLAQAVHRVREAQSKHESEADAAQLAAETGLKEAHVQRALDTDRSCMSLQRPVRSDESDAACLADLLPDPQQSEHKGEEASAERLHDSLLDQLAELPEREAEILRLRFGVDQDHAWTLEEVKTRLGISRERVRQLQNQALERLRRPGARRQLEVFL